MNWRVQYILYFGFLTLLVAGVHWYAHWYARNGHHAIRAENASFMIGCQIRVGDETACRVALAEWRKAEGR